MTQLVVDACLCFLLTAVFFFSCPKDLYAQCNHMVMEDVLEGSSEFEEVFALQDEMISWMEGLGNESAKDVEICYDQALKIYDGAGVLQMKTDDSEAILDMVEQNGHLWLIPARMNGKFYELTVAKGLPLTEDAKQYLTPKEQQEIRDKEGKWTITECGAGSGEYQSVWDRTKAQAQNLNDCDRVILVNNLPGFQYPVLLGMKDQRTVSLAGIGYGYSVISDYEDAAQTQKAKKMDSDGVYGFWELAACAEPYLHGSPDLIGGASSGNERSGSHFLFIGFPVAAVAVLALIAIYQGRKRKV